MRRGLVDVNVIPECVASFGGLERWDGKRGAGNLNAHHCMARANALAGTHGIGAVALAQTNHWMRGGAYGWQAADAGMIDMAMSQFSYGALAVRRMRGEELPVDGGYDEAGNLTRSPAAIEISGWLLPTGFWKGSGLAIVMDMIAALLSGGRATHEITGGPADETGQSQVFLAIDPTFGGIAHDANAGLDAIIADLHLAGDGMRYPGERTLDARRLSMQEGVEVEPSLWAEVCAMRP